MRTSVIFIILAISYLTGFSQTTTKTIKQSFISLSTTNHVTYFEVTNDMFASLTKTYKANPEIKEYISKLNSLKMMQASGEKRKEIGLTIYTNFIEQTNLDGFTLLLVNNDQQGKMSFFKKSNKGENEFLLVSTNLIMHITGTIEINNLAEFEQIINVVGDAIDI